MKSEGIKRIRNNSFFLIDIEKFVNENIVRLKNRLICL